MSHDWQGMRHYNEFHLKGSKKRMPALTSTTRAHSCRHEMTTAHRPGNAMTFKRIAIAVIGQAEGAQMSPQCYPAVRAGLREQGRCPQAGQALWGQHLAQCSALHAQYRSALGGPFGADGARLGVSGSPCGCMGRTQTYNALGWVGQGPAACNSCNGQ